MRMHEILGVEPGEAFCFDAEKYKYMVSNQGYLLYDKFGVGWTDVTSIDRLTEIINHPDRIIRIIRKPRLTREQFEVLKALKVLGCKWMAKDENGSCYGYTVKPMKSIGGWYGGNYIFADGVSNSLSPLVSWSDPEPLNIVQTLKDAGEE